MIRKSRACIASVIIVSVLIFAVVFHSPAFASEHYFNAGVQADSYMVHAVLARDSGDALLADLEADAVLLDRFYEDGSAPAVVRLTGSKLPAGFFPDRQSTLPESKSAVHTRFPEDLAARTAADVSSLNVKRFGMIPATAVQADADELEALIERLNDIDSVDAVPVKPVLQDNNYFGGTQEASIIAVPVVTLFNDQTKGGGDLDLYVGVNSLLGEDYEQQYGLLQAGQSFIAGITWTF
jgi:hypothetical protein